MSNFDTRETEQTFLIGQNWEAMYRDRYAYQRETLINEAVKAWRANPLARRLANLYKIFNIDGIEYKCDHPGTQKFLTEFWTHDLNNMDETLEEISNEMFLTGNVFPMFSVDASGMSYLRIYPTDQIAQIVTAENDIRQEIAYITKIMGEDSAERRFTNPRGQPSASTPQFMEHYAINKLAGTCWGEGEIFPDLPWLGRYASWLESRVRLNQYRTSFLYTVMGSYKSREEKDARSRELNSNPPRPGSILVMDTSEIWGTMSANLDAFDSSVDGMAIKKMVAVNHVPMHYLAEGEGSTQTTSDAAGTPAFKGFENHQEMFKRIVKRILVTVAKRRAEKDSTVSSTAEIEVTSGDVTERDNAGLALATAQMVQAIGDMFDRELIDSDEYLRLVYRFAGETRDPDKAVPKGLRKPLDAKRSERVSGIKINTKTGETSTPNV